MLIHHLRMFQIHIHQLRYLVVLRVLIAHSRCTYFADEFLCQNMTMLLHDWRSCNTQAVNLRCCALLPSLNPLSFDVLMNLKRFLWQFPGESHWKAVILSSSVISQPLSENQADPFISWSLWFVHGSKYKMLYRHWVFAVFWILT